VVGSREKKTIRTVGVLGKNARRENAKDRGRNKKSLKKVRLTQKENLWNLWGWKKIGGTLREEQSQNKEKKKKRGQKNQGTPEDKQKKKKFLKEHMLEKEKKNRRERFRVKVMQGDKREE